MKTFEFAIIASGLDRTADDFETQFYDAGCDDATVSFQKGVTIVDFAREARSIDEAIELAVRDVRKAGARIERIEPDPLVSLSDIATRANMSRAAMSNYASALRGKDFPAPVARVTTDSPLWDWVEVSQWLCLNNRVSREMVIEARAVRAANAALQAASGDIGARVRDGSGAVEVTH